VPARSLTLGPLPNNVYLLGDADSGDAVVIDPTYDSRLALAKLKNAGGVCGQSG